MRKQTTPQSESQIQHDCLTWFRLQYPKLALLMFAVPNGGRRDAKSGARMKYEGVVKGVADLILLIPKKGYASLCIEMKTPKGVQGDNQKEWQKRPFDCLPDAIQTAAFPPTCRQDSQDPDKQTRLLRSHIPLRLSSKGRIYPGMLLWRLRHQLFR